MEWTYLNLVIERLFHFIWLHPAWTVFFIVLLCRGNHVVNVNK